MVRIASPKVNDRFRALPVLPDAIPAELRHLPQWVCWRAVARPGSGRPAKVPLTPDSLRPASPTDPATWGTFADAMRAYNGGGAVDGVGFVLADADLFAAVDLDDVLDPIVGEPSRWAAAIVEELASYAEVSPSGSGLRIMVRGRLPGRGLHSKPIEVYDRSRFVTITGHALPGSPRTVEERQAELENVYARHGGGKVSPPASAMPAAVPVALDDDTLLRKASTARNGQRFARLWDGDASGYPTQSEADLALCGHLAFWTGPDPERIADLFTRSGLARGKWNRPDYRTRTIAKALETRTVYYAPASPTMEVGILSVGVHTQLCSSPEGGTNCVHNPTLRIPTGEVGYSRGVRAAIEATVPSCAERLKPAMLQLARRLKAIPETAGAEPGDLSGIVNEWHTTSGGALVSVPPVEVRRLFAQAWRDCRVPAGTGLLEQMLERARERPVEGLDSGYRGPAFALLAGVCRELQEASGGSAFYLSQRAAADLLDISVGAACGHFRALRDRNILSIVQRGDRRTGKASFFVYRCPDSRTRG